MTGTPWHTAPLVALDLEGSGAQGREREVILEVAAVPIVGGRADATNAYSTVVNPGRAVPRRPWIPAGLTNAILREAPPLSAVERSLTHHINGRYLVGHNVSVDWRPLHRLCPTIQPRGLIDTLRLARHLNLAVSNRLTSLVEERGLTSDIDSGASDSRPHRALWDALAAATLLTSLISSAWSTPPTIDELVAVAGPPRESPSTYPSTDQPTLFD